MSSGTPDYYQTVRNTYGSGKATIGSQLVVANDYTTLFTITGKGMTYGGWLGIDYTSAQTNSAILVIIDGNGIAALSFGTLLGWNIVKPRTSPLILLACDEVNFIYSAGIAYGLTFEKSFVILYYENHGTTPTVFYNLVYALLE